MQQRASTAFRISFAGWFIYFQLLLIWECYNSNYQIRSTTALVSLTSGWLLFVWYCSTAYFFATAMIKEQNENEFYALIIFLAFGVCIFSEMIWRSINPFDTIFNSLSESGFVAMACNQIFFTIIVTGS